MSAFEASLRSSPKPSSRKSSKDSSARASPIPPLKQALLGQPIIDASRALLSSSALKPPMQTVDSVERIWEPPLSCQRATVRELSCSGSRTETLYFPFELTTGEYVERSLKLLTAAVSALVNAKDHSGQPLNESGNENVVGLVGLLGHYSTQLRSTTARTSVLSDLRGVAGMAEHAKTLVQAHGRECLVSEALSDSGGSDQITGRLGDLSAVFSSAKAVATVLAKQCATDAKLKAAGDVCSAAMQGLEQLEQQHRLHRVSKDQRMAALGWLWPSASTPADLRASFSKSQSFDFTGASLSLSATNNGESKANSSSGGSSEDRQAWEAVRTEAEEVTVQLQALLQPTTLANVQLFHRLVCIVQDLDVLMRALSADSEYQEAQRVRELKAVVDATVTPQGRALLDQVRQCCSQAQILVAELRRHCDECRARGGYFEEALRCEKTARDLNRLQRELRTNGIAPFSLLSQPSVVDRLSREGSAFVCSDFLFSEPHQQQAHRVVTAGGGSSGDLSPLSPVHHQMQAVPSPYDPSASLRVPGGAEGVQTGTAPVSIGSLVIRAGSNAVLNAIRSSWPGLTALGGRVPGGSTIPPSPGAAQSPGRWSVPAQHALGSNPPTPVGAAQMPRSPSATSSLHGAGAGTGTGASIGPQREFTASGVLPLSPIYPSPLNRTAQQSGHFFPGTSQQLPHSLRPASHSHSPRGDDTHLDFNPADTFNEVGFSPTILSVLMSFEELQRQLHELLSPAAVALTQLMQRLVGFSADLLFLSERCHRSGQYSEGDRLLALRAAVEGALESDHEDAVHELVCGRGRRRLDNLHVLTQQVQLGSKELQRLAMRSRSECDFTGAQALDEVAADLTGCLARIEEGLKEGVFSMLDSEHGVASAEYGLEITEHIAREGTGFITSDYVFQFASGREGHSIGSLAIIAGAGAVLRFIRAEWPELTALSAPLYGQPQLPSHGHGRGHEGQWGDLSFEVESKAAAAMAAAGASPLQESASGAMNFRDAASLRLLGFDAATLRLAGFSDIAVVTAGYTAAELRDANFSTEQLRQAGLSDSALRVVGYQTEQQADVLASLFRATEGGKWKEAQGWRELLRNKRAADLAPPHLLHVSGAVTPLGLQQQQPPQLAQRVQLAGLRGVRCDDTTGEVVRIHLASNNLAGQLPSNIGSLTSLTQLILSDNSLSGSLPVSLGLLVNLENLHLDGNNFEGEIPRSLKSLVHLVVLKLERNRLTGPIPAVLGGLQRLRRLDLSHNALTGAIPPRLTQLPALQELLLNDNQLGGCVPENIGHLANLSSLQLQNNRLQGYVPASIARLGKLTGLNIQQNPDLVVDRLQLQRALPRCRIKM